MFGFTRRKVHSNNRKKDKTKDVRDPPPKQQPSQQYAPTVTVTAAVPPVASPSTPPDPFEYSFDDLSSVDDMSLYTSQSKSTVRYPPHLLNYGGGGGRSEGYEDSHDALSCAPSEFTTEIAMKHYARLGGAWRPHQTTPLPYDGSPTSSRNNKTPPSPKHDQSLIRRRPMDEESVAAASVLPATAKMARITLQEHSFAKTTLPAPVDLDDSVADTESARSLLLDSPPRSATSTSTLPVHESTRTAALTTVRRSNTTPVDLDVSVADSESVRSLLDSPLRTTPAPFSKRSKSRTLEQLDTSVLSISLPLSLSAEDADDDGSLTFSPSPLNEISVQDEDTYGFSVASDQNSATSAVSHVSKPKRDRLAELFQGGLDDSFPSSDGSKVSTKGRAKQNDESTMSLQYSIDSNRTPQMPSPVPVSQPTMYSLETVMARSLSKFQTDRTPTSSKEAPEGPSPSTIGSRSTRSDWVNKIQPRPTPQTKLARWSTPTTTSTTSALASRDQATPQLKPKTVQTSSMVVEPDCGQSVVSALTAAAAVEDEQDDDDTYGFSTTSATLIPQIPHEDPLTIGALSSPIVVEDDEPVVWTDQREDERQTATPPKQEIRDDVLDRTYQETMDTISFARRSHDFTSLSEDNQEKETSQISTGAVLLTETELRKHLKKVQYVQPLPSSEIQGYDSWKQQMEQKQKYFAKIQAQAARQELLKSKDSKHMKRYNPDSDSRPAQSRPMVRDPSHGSQDRPVNSTRSAMNRSIDSSIPTIDDGKAKPRQKNGSLPRSTRGGWGCFLLDKRKKNQVEKKKSNTTKTTKSRNSSSQSTDKTKKPKTSEHKAESAVVPLSQFMQISADEASEKRATFSPRPIHNNNGAKPLRTSPLQNTSTKSRRDDDYGVGTRKLVPSLRSDERRNPGNISNQVKEPEEDRIARLRQEAIQNQRRLRLKEIERLSAQATMTNRDRVVLHQDTGSRSSGPAKLLAPCVICKSSERSHIAMPCMHFSFCKNCIDNLSSQSVHPQCPVCSARNVTFTRVYTG